MFGESTTGQARDVSVRGKLQLLSIRLKNQQRAPKVPLCLFSAPNHLHFAAGPQWEGQTRQTTRTPTQALAPKQGTREHLVDAFALAHHPQTRSRPIDAASFTALLASRTFTLAQAKCVRRISLSCCEPATARLSLSPKSLIN